MPASPAYQEMVDFIAEANPQRLLEYHPSDDVKARVAELIQREKTEGLTKAERSELEHSMQFEHLMRLAKAKARQLLSE